MSIKRVRPSGDGKDKMVFLLGGADLEMVTIRNLLDKEGIQYIDKGLSWGASVSDYRDELQSFGSGVRIYGVELQETEDVVLPEGYVRIDHHNDYAGRRSSIEQVAEIVGVPLTRELQLVAANDCGYIPAMKEMGATDEEIADIRFRDRAAQGVTPEEEDMALKAVRSSCRRSEGWAVVRVPDELSRFSVITDRLFGTENILIYNGHELCYYGPEAYRLGERYDSLVKAGKAYYGGKRDSGYFGIGSDALPKDELQGVVNEILKGRMKESLRSGMRL